VKRKHVSGMSNRLLYTLITIGILAIFGFGVYAVGTTPNPGHAITDIQPCGDGEILKMNGGSWSCGTDEVGTSPWLISGSDIYYNGGLVGIGTNTPTSKLDVNGSANVSGNISMGGIKMWFQANGSRIQLCYNGPSCALRDNTCDKTFNYSFPLEPGVTCNEANKSCQDYCSGRVACSGAEFTGCLGSSDVYYNSGKAVSCDDSHLRLTCSCSVTGAKYYDEYLSDQTCIG